MTEGIVRAIEIDARNEASRHHLWCTLPYFEIPASLKEVDVLRVQRIDLGTWNAVKYIFIFDLSGESWQWNGEGWRWEVKPEENKKSISMSYLINYICPK